MIDSRQEQLLGHLLGVLDDSEQAVVEARLKSDPLWRQELAGIRRQLEPLDACRCQFDPPRGLAERTCQAVASYVPRNGHAAQPGDHAVVPRREIPKPTRWFEPPCWVGQIRLADVVMAATVFVAAALLTIPAIQHSRFRSRVVACQNNLKELGQAMKLYATGQYGFFPRIPSQGKLAAAGIYAPTLKEAGLLTDDRWVLCPGSPLADQGPLDVPSMEELDAASPAQLVAWRKSMGGSYGYHLGHVRDGVYQGTKDLNRSHFPLMADAPAGVLIPGYQSDHHAGRGQNVLFEDGRVQFLTTSRLVPDNDDIFANDDGDVAAGKHPDDSVIGPSYAVPLIYLDNPH
ncbi:MAG: hypothetical protein JXB62_12010 [Pirellulales bacterium]|nr:hypothetical protein [Pirellulales bacterium]